MLWGNHLHPFHLKLSEPFTRQADVLSPKARPSETLHAIKQFHPLLGSSLAIFFNSNVDVFEVILFTLFRISWRESSFLVSFDKVSLPTGFLQLGRVGGRMKGSP